MPNALYARLYMRGKTQRGPAASIQLLAPNAWASAAPFAFLWACLGMEMRLATNSVSFRDPVMYSFLGYVALNRLSLGISRVDLRRHRHGGDATLDLLHRQGDAKVMAAK